MPTPKSDADRTLAEFWRSYVEADRGGLGYVVRNPLMALRALRAIQRLPVVHPAQRADTPGGRAIWRILHQKGPLGSPARWWGFTVLPINGDPADSLKSPEAKRLRYNLRLAEPEGITCRPVHPGERAALVEQANQRERTHPDEAYRVSDPRNDDLPDYGHWILAEDSAGQPLLLAVAASDGELAVLRYFRTFGDSEKHSLSRYLSHLALVEELAEHGVRWLLDNHPPGAQTNGVRQFQRILGFRHVRIRRPCIV